MTTTTPPPGYVLPPAVAAINKETVDIHGTVPSMMLTVQQLLQQLQDAQVQLNFVVSNGLTQLRLQADNKIAALEQALVDALNPPPPAYDTAL